MLARHCELLKSIASTDDGQKAVTDEQIADCLELAKDGYIDAAFEAADGRVYVRITAAGRSALLSVVA